MGDTVRKTELFGIGTRYDIACRGDHKISVMVLKDGTREIYELGPAGSDPVAVIRLDEDESRRVAAVLSGTYFD